MASKFVACALLLIQGISAQVIGNMYGPLMAPNFAAEAAISGAMGPGMSYPGNLANIYGPGGIGPNLAAEAALAGAIGQGMPYPGMPYPPAAVYDAAPVLQCGFGLTLADLAANGKGFAVTSTSPSAPTGITVQSDNLLFEGPLAVTGTMPFLGSVSLEGPLPATGQGEVAYGCGNGNIGIVSEELPSPPAANSYPGTGQVMAYEGYGPRQGYGLMY